jgi:hypothetical protein
VLQVSEADRAALLDVAPSKRALALGRQVQKKSNFQQPNEIFNQRRLSYAPHSNCCI